MLGISIQTSAVFFLVTIATLGLAWVFIYPHLSGEKRTEQRRASIGLDAKSQTANSMQRVRNSPKSRREQVEERVKDIDLRGKKKKPPLQIRITQAGLTWSKRTFLLISASLGVVVFLLTLLQFGLLPAIGFGFAAAFGAPLWLLQHLKKKREAKFLNAFPDAVDVVVRGLKSGLPLIDSLRVIATDAPEPVRSEFRTILDTQAIGIPLGEACQKLYERMPVAETNFFGIVVAIQQRSGGNLSEALGNLSRVLRDRKKMKARIQAMSMEAKASAAIIGVLPFVVGFLFYLINPQYIALLWTHPMGQLLLTGAIVWMMIGMMMMRKMINFDF